MARSLLGTELWASAPPETVKMQNPQPAVCVSQAHVAIRMLSSEYHEHRAWALEPDFMVRNPSSSAPLLVPLGKGP